MKGREAVSVLRCGMPGSGRTTRTFLTMGAQEFRGGRCVSKVCNVFIASEMS